MFSACVIISNCVCVVSILVILWLTFRSVECIWQYMLYNERAALCVIFHHSPGFFLLLVLSFAVFSERYTGSEISVPTWQKTHTETHMRTHTHICTQLHEEPPTGAQYHVNGERESWLFPSRPQEKHIWSVFSLLKLLVFAPCIALW